MNTEFRFDDFGFNDKLAIVDRSDNYEWVEPQISSLFSAGVVRVELVADSGEGDDDVRKTLREYVEQNYVVDIQCDFGDEADISRAVSEAVAIRDRFLAGNYVSFGEMA